MLATDFVATDTPLSTSSGQPPDFYLLFFLISQPQKIKKPFSLHFFQELAGTKNKILLLIVGWIFENYTEDLGWWVIGLDI